MILLGGEGHSLIVYSRGEERVMKGMRSGHVVGDIEGGRGTKVVNQGSREETSRFTSLW